MVFDLVGVVIDSHSKTKYNLNNARKDIANACNFDTDVFLDFFEDNRFGIASGKKFDNLIKEYINKCKSNIDINKFKEIYIKYYGKISCYREVVEFIEELQEQKNCKTAILSKLCELDKAYIEKHLKLNKFDYLFLSCDLEMEKPDVRAFEYVNEKIEIEGKNILFIDDSIKNIEIAKSLGWNTCNATGDEIDRIKENVRKFLK